MLIHDQLSTFPLARHAKRELETHVRQAIGIGYESSSGDLVLFGPGCEAQSLEQARDLYALSDAYELPGHRTAAPTEFPDPQEPKPGAKRVGGVTLGSKTHRALALVKEGMSALDAADSVGINPSAVYRALKRAEGRRCRACGEVL